MPPRKRPAKAVLEPASEPPKEHTSGNAYDFDMEDDLPLPVAAAVTQPNIQRAPSPKLVAKVVAPVAVVSKLVEVNNKLASPPKGKDALLKLLKVGVLLVHEAQDHINHMHINTGGVVWVYGLYT